MSAGRHLKSDAHQHGDDLGPIGAEHPDKGLDFAEYVRRELRFAPLAARDSASPGAANGGMPGPVALLPRSIQPPTVLGEDPIGGIAGRDVGNHEPDLSLVVGNDRKAGGVVALAKDEDPPLGHAEIRAKPPQPMIRPALSRTCGYGYTQSGRSTPAATMPMRSGIDTM